MVYAHLQHADDDGLTAVRQPRQVPEIGEPATVAAGFWHSAALDRHGNVWTRGANHCGQLGDRTANRPRPAVIEPG